MKKNALVTGSNRGIGLELAKQLLEHGYHVIAACRKASPELKALDLQVEEGIDVSQQSSVLDLKHRVGDTKLDLLIQNAGIGRKETLDDFNLETIREQFEVNTIAPLFVTRTLLSQMKQPSKVAFITSRMGSIADNTSGGHYGYRMSKAALNAGAVSLTADLRPKQISVAILHPGFVKTDMTRGNGDLTTEESAKGLLDRILNDCTPETSGTFWHSQGQTLPW